VKSSQKYRIHIQRGVGFTGITIDVPVDVRDEAVAHAKELMESMPESTFQGEGVAISTIPRFGPSMDAP
jgi:hypothetical protein